MPADNMALAAFAAAHNAVAWLLLSASGQQYEQYLMPHSSKPTSAACGRRMEQRDRKHCYIDPVPHTMWSVPII